jgi:hypothetical protein
VPAAAFALETLLLRWRGEELDPLAILVDALVATSRIGNPSNESIASSARSDGDWGMVTPIAFAGAAPRHSALHERTGAHRDSAREQRLIAERARISGVAFPD